MGKKRIATNEEGADLEKDGSVSKKARKIQRLRSARIYIAASYNNTSATLTDAQGNVIAWSTAGSLGFKGPKKATPYAASKVIETILEKIGGAELENTSVFVQGVGSGRDAALRALAGKGVDIGAIKDMTPIPHNGCRPPKARRV